jgi:hypothetical protein
LKLHLKIENDVSSVFRTHEISAIWWPCEQALYLGLHMYLGVKDEENLLDNLESSLDKLECVLCQHTL